MKRVIVSLIVLLICTAGTKAQGILNQKGSQLKRLAEQVALLQTYMGYLKEGYRIADKGLATINDIKNGDLNIHKIFFSSLKQVNPNILKYSKVADILYTQVRTLRSCRQASTFVQRSGMYGEQEIEQLKRLFQKVIKECAYVIDELAMLTTNGNLEMTDDERIKRIDGLHKEMTNTAAFNEWMRNQASQMSTYRRHQQNELIREERLHGFEEK